MKVPPELLPQVVGEMLTGMAKLQARHDMLEAVLRALIAETPPAHPLFWKALHTAKSDLDRRSAATRAENPAALDAEALALWNELCAACAPPAGKPQG